MKYLSLAATFIWTWIQTLLGLVGLAVGESVDD